MKLTKLQYGMLRRIAQSERVSSSELSEYLNISLFRVSKNLRALKEQNLISKSGRFLNLNDSGFVSILSRFLIDHPEIENVLADSGFIILQLFETPKSIGDIIRITGLSERTAYRYIRAFLNRGLITSNYVLNDKIWPDLRELIIVAKNSIKIPGIPLSAKIYLQEERTIFSTELPVKASVTAFSRYSDFGIPIIEQEKFYRLPQKKLTIKDIYIDSLDCLTNIRRKILAVLLYLKHYEKLRRIAHPEAENIKKVLKGDHIPNYPTINDIKERAKMYDIKI